MGSAYFAWVLYFAAAVVCQLLWGDVPVGFLAFPVNVALLLLWCVCLWVLYKEKRRSAFVVWLLDVRTTFLLLGVCAVCALIQGLVPFRVTGSWWFGAALLALLSHLLMIVFRRLEHPRPYNLRFVLNHVGLFLLLAGGFWGVSDQHEWRARVAEGETVCEVYDAAGRKKVLEYELRLLQVETDYYADGTPRNYEVRLQKDGREIVLRVNHPYVLSWRDKMYLMGVDRTAGQAADGHCVLLFVRQPWQWVQWSGILMLLAGGVLLFVQGAYRKGGKADGDVE